MAGWCYGCSAVGRRFVASGIITRQVGSWGVRLSTRPDSTTSQYWRSHDAVFHLAFRNDSFREQLKPADLDKLKFTDQATRWHQVLDDLIAKYPQEIEPFTRLISFVRNSEPEQLPALQDRFRQQVAQHPDDPIALYVAGLALKDSDTDESIRLLNPSPERRRSHGLHCSLLRSMLEASAPTRRSRLRTSNHSFRRVRLRPTAGHSGFSARQETQTCRAASPVLFASVWKKKRIAARCSATRHYGG